MSLSEKIKSQIPIWLANYDMADRWYPNDILQVFKSLDDFNKQVRDPKNWKRFQKEKITKGDINGDVSFTVPTPEDSDDGQVFLDYENFEEMWWRRYTSKLDFCTDTFTLDVVSSLDDERIIFWCIAAD